MKEEERNEADLTSFRKKRQTKEEKITNAIFCFFRYFSLREYCMYVLQVSGTANLKIIIN